jgi:predicted nucleotidyltransferase
MLTEIPKQIRTMIFRVRDEVLAYPWVQKVMLYGSFAKGTYHSESDLDLAMFVEHGHPCGVKEYLQLCRHLRQDAFDIQIQLFSYDELADPCGIVEEIVSSGVDITSIQRT